LNVRSFIISYRSVVAVAVVVVVVVVVVKTVELTDGQERKRENSHEINNNEVNRKLLKHRVSPSFSLELQKQKLQLNPNLPWSSTNFTRTQKI